MKSLIVLICLATFSIPTSATSYNAEVTKIHGWALDRFRQRPPNATSQPFLTNLIGSHSIPQDQRKLTNQRRRLGTCEQVADRCKTSTTNLDSTKERIKTHYFEFGLGCEWIKNQYHNRFDGCAVSNPCCCCDDTFVNTTNDHLTTILVSGVSDVTECSANLLQCDNIDCTNPPSSCAPKVDTRVEMEAWCKTREEVGNFVISGGSVCKMTTETTVQFGTHLMLTGDDPNNLAILSGEHQSRHFSVYGDLTLKYLILENGYNALNGGSIRAETKLNQRLTITLVGLVLRHNKAGKSKKMEIWGEGGAIALSSTLPDHQLQQIVVEPEYDNPLILLLKDVTFDSNVAAEAGGAVSVLPSIVWERNSMCARKIMECKTSKFVEYKNKHGKIYNEWTETTKDDCVLPEFSKCTGTMLGPLGHNCVLPEIPDNKCRWANNYQIVIRVVEGSFVTFQNNIVEASILVGGGAVKLFGNACLFEIKGANTRALFTNNRVFTASGGAVNAYTSSDFHITDGAKVTFHGNSAQMGGALYVLTNALDPAYNKNLETFIQKHTTDQDIFRIFEEATGQLKIAGQDTSVIFEANVACAGGASKSLKSVASDCFFFFIIKFLLSFLLDDLVVPIPVGSAHK